MIFRNCAGGVVFYANQVFLLKNEKNEWVLPKGKIRNDESSIDAAISRVKIETSLDTEILSTAGETCYEFFSISRKQPVCNQITWYIMITKNKESEINKKLGFKDGGFFPIDEAIRIISYSQDQSLVNLSYKKYKEIMKEKKERVAV
ncbi:NUDIX domain-containing protein [Anaerovirgula multivorans]|uniref:NUDIX domain-containing protein n=1 Tax=Anaerovirgula multivorans TaxID=312168 RepID=A0A239DWP3_9FIRM|nr:NUDIX hydrolase [Anaerovirgula multivorans]SNS36034.1 NUDIX domain-containing protein [Anaerovirgula multivorans]